MKKFFNRLFCLVLIVSFVSGFIPVQTEAATVIGQYKIYTLPQKKWVKSPVYSGNRQVFYKFKITSSGYYKIQFDDSKLKRNRHNLAGVQILNTYRYDDDDVTYLRWERSSDELEFGAALRKVASCLSGQGVILFHGSAICVDGRTYIFTAPSGTGKSTHSRLWRELLKEHEVVMVNDDKPFLKVKEGCVTAYGSPWMGKEGLGCNMSAPVEAICSISQGTRNVIREATPDEMYPIFYEQSLRPFDKVGTENYLHILITSYQMRTV